MRVDQSKCTGCLRCVPHCPVGAIAKVMGERLVDIDQDECVECSVCFRAQVCSPQALYQPPLDWPRILRAEFSDPVTIHPKTGVGGRGTEEMKTNDVTGRFGPGRVGMAAELGRPSLGARFVDVQKVAMAVAPLGVNFEPMNPVTFLMEDQATGKLREDCLGEKVLSAIVEFDAALEQVPEIVATLNRVAQEVDTVFSVDLASLVSRDGTVPVESIDLAALGRPLSINGKTNIGLGKPKAKSLEGYVNDTY